ncbi:MAG: acetate/propionate family kinase [Herpetosiphonaceae bacterium]|nr:acetate/propionate family kinase [Herpetosiphonaceae bacterium]
MDQTIRVLTINTGSSSLKAAVYEVAAAETLAVAVEVERIGQAGSRLHAADANGRPLHDQQLDLATHAAALEAVLAWLTEQGWTTQLQAAGHRVVHGGQHYREPHILTPAIFAALEQVVELAPEHLPQALAAMQTLTKAYPSLPQVVCFDTAFHRQMPRVAQLFALPRHLLDAGLMRYGFHGLSYEYIMHELQHIDPAAAQGRIIVAHLGNGASMAAVRDGMGIDTTMGFTPTGGLVMGTRSGDLDPGILVYLLQAQGLKPTELSQILNKQAGLLGVSSRSSDMQDLLSNEAVDPHVAEAIELFCYQAKKFVGALTAALGGLDTFVFTGGIGQHASPIRTRICAGLEFLGIQLNAGRNAAHDAVISHTDSAVVVRVMATDEDRMIARHTYHLITGGGGFHVEV